MLYVQNTLDGFIYRLVNDSRQNTDSSICMLTSTFCIMITDRSVPPVKWQDEGRPRRNCHFPLYQQAEQARSNCKKNYTTV